MGIKNKISEGYLYFLTLTVVDSEQLTHEN